MAEAVPIDEGQRQCERHIVWLENNQHYRLHGDSECNDVGQPMAPREEHIAWTGNGPKSQAAVFPQILALYHERQEQRESNYDPKIQRVRKLRFGSKIVNSIFQKNRMVNFSGMSKIEKNKVFFLQFQGNF